MNRKDFVVKTVTWNEAQKELRHVREAVFVREQGVPADLEWDGKDDSARHVLAALNGEPVGTGRLILRDGHLGRMAVLAPYRHQGVGSKILEGLLSVAREQKLKTAWLSSQTSALGFYQKHGFTAFGPVFREAGLPHQKMQREL
jgi:predicted GNAT family N-acyltransferase